MQRLAGRALLLVAGMLSLPLAALFLDDEGTENWILPAALGGMAVLGALVGLALPEFSRDGASPRRRALVGSATGVAAAVLGTVVFFLILNGFDGA